jgi:UDP-3-O-[3-hydroxymyristoyl] N-acetylglucosamine deacetylase
MPDHVALEGVGLHSGALGSVALSREGADIVTFRRIDVQPEQRYEARLMAAQGEARQTRLRSEAGPTLATVEHVLAASAGMGRWGACWLVSGSELPILDGSAAPFCELLRGARSPKEHALWRVGRTFEWGAGSSSYRIEPASAAQLVCTSVFDHPAIGEQRVAWDVGDVDHFRRELAPARTFGFVAELEQLREAGLIRGGTPDCALLFDARAPLSPPRFADEPGRHKLLDLIGDLALLGGPLRGVLHAERPSHAATVGFLRAAVESGALVEG